MKILYVSNDSVLGGAAFSLINSISIMKSMAEVIVILPKEGNVSNYLSEIGISYRIIPFQRDYFPLKSFNPDTSFELLSDNYFAALEVAKIIEDEQIDIVHTNSSVGNVGIIAALLTDRPHVWHIRELMEEDFFSCYFDKAYKTKLFGASDKIVTISDYVKSTFLKKYNIDSIRIYNGIDRGKIDSSETARENNSFLFAGKICESKGQFDAVKAVNRLVNNDGIDLKLYIVGDGDGRYFWAIKQYIKRYKLDKYIEIISFQNNLALWRKTCQYAIVGSKMEALGRVTVEAMTSKQLVIGANTGGTIELIGRDNQRGFLYDEGDAESLANTIKAAIFLPQERKDEIINSAYDFGIQVFDTKKYADRIFELYVDTINSYEKTDAKSEILQDIILNSENNKQKRIKKDDIVNPARQLSDKIRSLENRGIEISQYFVLNHISSVAIYGMGNFGCKVYEELLYGGIMINYVIDNNPEYINEFIKVISPNDAFPDAELIIVCVAAEEKSLVEYINNRGMVRAIGLSNIIDNLLEAYPV